MVSRSSSGVRAAGPAALRPRVLWLTLVTSFLGGKIRSEEVLMIDLSGLNSKRRDLESAQSRLKSAAAGLASAQRTALEKYIEAEASFMKKLEECVHGLSKESGRLLSKA